MKNFLLPAVLFSILSLTSCSKDQIDPIAAQDTPEKAEARVIINTVSNTLLAGSWNITSCIISGKETAPQYKEYSLAFAANNMLIAKDAATAGAAGNWIVSCVDGKARVNFTFLSNSAFDAINGSWTVLDGSTSKKTMLQSVTDSKCFLTLER